MPPLNGARIELLPDDSELTPWQQCVKAAMLHVLSHNQRYNNTLGSGFSETVTVAGYTIKADRGSNCSGTTFQVFLQALQLWAGDADLSEFLTAGQVKELYSHFHANHANYMYGATGALLQLKTFWPWLKVDAVVGTLLTPESRALLQFGDVLSLQDTKNPWGSGHSMTVVDVRESYDSETGGEVEVHSPVVIVFDSYNHPGKKSDWLRKNQDTGAGLNWWRLDRHFGVWTRKWYTAGIRNTGWLQDEVGGKQ